MCLLWSKLNWVVDAQGKVVSNILVDLSWEMKHVRAFKQSLSIKENTVITVHSRKLNPWETEFCGIILMLRKGVCLIQSSLLQPSSQFMNKAYWKQFYLVQPYSSCTVEWMWALQQSIYDRYPPRIPTALSESRAQISGNTQSLLIGSFLDVCTK